jgi:DNA invertase Pin-like site-specific DNA recombinase
MEHVDQHFHRHADPRASATNFSTRAGDRSGPVQAGPRTDRPEHGGERLDTRNPTSKLMPTIPAGVATWEREIMLERQREGIAKAKSEGKYKGRPASIDAAETKRLTGTMGPAAIAKQLGITRSTVYRLLEPAKAAA